MFTRTTLFPRTIYSYLPMSSSQYSFFSRTICMCISFPVEVFPVTYNIKIFKSSVYKHYCLLRHIDAITSKKKKKKQIHSYSLTSPSWYNCKIIQALEGIILLVRALARVHSLVWPFNRAVEFRRRVEKMILWLHSIAYPGNSSLKENQFRLLGA